MIQFYKGKQKTDGKYTSLSHLLPLRRHVNLLWYLYGLHLHVRVVLLIILFSEAITVVQQEGTTQQLHRLTHLKVFGGVVLIHFLC